MKIQTKFIIYLAGLHLVVLAFIWWQQVPPAWLIAMEVFLLLSFALGWWWIHKLMQPFQLISTGIENIKSSDFGIQLKKTGQPEFDQLVEVYNAMIQRLRQERISTSEMNFLLASIINTSPTGIVLFDYDDAIKAVNPAAENLLNKKESELKGCRKADLSAELVRILYYDQEQWIVIRQSARQIFRVYSGRFMNRGFETRFVLFEEFSEEIYQLEKQSYEKVIRMMGHEVNNTLGPVNSVLDTYLDNHQDRFAPTFRICRDRNQNLTRFMQRLVEVVKLPPPEKQLIDILPLIRQTTILLKARFETKKIDWQVDLTDQPFRIPCDQLQMEQVIINILTNAAEAIEEQGFIQVRFTNQPARLIISNNGQPLTQEVQKQIFTPFFTTKANGQGIGLTLCREILSRHGFGYTLATNGDGITSFEIELKGLGY
ncbi:MAG: sensor histidine kinase [Candidatus Cyclobacteriaceae bacterium M3_2C_046]